MRVSKLFGAGVTGRLLTTRYNTQEVYAWFQNRHAKHARTLLDKDGYYRTTTDRKINGNLEHEWKVPYGIRYALSQPLIHCQIINRYPWSVTWKSPKSGKRLRKHFGSLASAIDFVATKAQYVDAKANIVSRQRHYDIPPKLRNKIPLPHKWCPRCLTARRFKRVTTATGEQETFFTQRKEWSEEKQRYEWRERKLALLRCPCCGTTNRNSVFRRSNQPWDLRKIKQGVTRAKKRRR